MGFYLPNFFKSRFCSRILSLEIRHFLWLLLLLVLLLVLFFRRRRRFFCNWSKIQSRVIIYPHQFLLLAVLLQYYIEKTIIWGRGKTLCGLWSQGEGAEFVQQTHTDWNKIIPIWNPTFKGDEFLKLWNPKFVFTCSKYR